MWLAWLREYIAKEQKNYQESRSSGEASSIYPAMMVDLYIFAEARRTLLLLRANQWSIDSF